MQIFKQLLKNIWNKLVSAGKVMFKEIFKNIKTRPEAVASFLAVLEMIKQNRVRVEYKDERDISNPTVYKTNDGDDLDLDVIED